MLFECRSAGRVRVDERLCVLAGCRCAVDNPTHAFDNDAAQAVRHEDDRPLARLPRLSFRLVSSLSTAYLCDLPLQAQVRDQRSCMVEKILAADPRPTVRVSIVAPAEYARVGKVVRQQVAQPVDAVGAATRRPRLLTVPIQAVDCDDAGLVSVFERAAMQRGDILNDWASAFTHYLQALQNCTSCLY